MPETSKFDYLWKRYEHDVNLHRTYLDLAIKLSLFHYAVTGAIISFYFVQKAEHPLITYSLLLPFFMSVSFAVFFFKAANAANISDKYIEKLANSLGYEVYSAVAKVLAFLMRIFLFLMLLTSAGIMVLFIQDIVINFCKIN